MEWDAWKKGWTDTLQVRWLDGWIEASSYTPDHKDTHRVCYVDDARARGAGDYPDESTRLVVTLFLPIVLASQPRPGKAPRKYYGG